MKLVLALLATSVFAQADTIQTVNAQYTNCNNSQTSNSTGTITETCGSNATSTADYLGSFDGSVSVGALAQSIPGVMTFADGSASITDTESEYLDVTGTTGTGYLTLNISSYGFGSENGYNSDSSMLFQTSYGSVTTPGFTCIESGYVCTWGIDGAAGSITIPITFGVPFLFTEKFELSVSALDDSGLGAGAYASDQILINEVVTNSSGSVIQTARVTDPLPGVPEPPTSLLILLGAVCLRIGCLRKQSTSR